MPQFIADDGTPIHYYDTGGNKPAIVFIHGWTSVGRHWAGSMLALRKQFRCIAPDLRGHGHTPSSDNLTITRLAQDVHDLIEYLHLEKPSIVGWSMGGLTTFEYLRLYGDDHLSHVVLVDQTPRLRTDDEWQMGLFGAYTSAHTEFLHEMFDKQQKRVLRRFAMGIIHPNRRVLRFVSWLTAPYRRDFDRKALMPLAVDMADRDYRDLLDQFHVPVLLCYGSQSWLYPGKVGEYLHQHIPNSTLVMFEKSGHCPPLEEPRKFNRTLRQFLAA